MIKIGPWGTSSLRRISTAATRAVSDFPNPIASASVSALPEFVEGATPEDAGAKINYAVLRLLSLSSFDMYLRDVLTKEDISKQEPEKNASPRGPRSYGGKKYKAGQAAARKAEEGAARPRGSRSPRACIRPWARTA
ncbi:hypothetical protein DL769_007368 [Monosporascus sp. CRB-8-3]|nr:hypothetical protein DL769_007368 [Monosporascus sp. CRB-8-3]